MPARNTVALSDTLIVSPKSPDDIGYDTKLRRHESSHTRQANERGGLGYATEYLVEFKLLEAMFSGKAGEQARREAANDGITDPAWIERRAAALAQEWAHDYHPMELDADKRAGLSPGWNKAPEAGKLPEDWNKADGEDPFKWIPRERLDGSTAGNDYIDATTPPAPAAGSAGGGGGSGGEG